QSACGCGVRVAAAGLRTQHRHALRVGRVAPDPPDDLVPLALALARIGRTEDRGEVSPRRLVGRDDGQPLGQDCLRGHVGYVNLNSGRSVSGLGDGVKPEPSPTARALLALELIQSTPGITADRIAQKIGVSERAARRYVGTLRETGIPIESVRGPYGGYRLGRGLRLPPLMFSAAEALGLVMAGLGGGPPAARGPGGAAPGQNLRGPPGRRGPPAPPHAPPAPAAPRPGTPR